MSIVGHEHMRSPLFVALALVGFAACSGTGEPAGPGPAKIVELDAGNFHTCVRLDDGTVECWGQCGPQCGVRPDGSTGRLPVAGLVGAVELAVGDSHGCARLPDGDVTCWGSNYSGGLGRLEPERSAMPMLVPDVHGATAIAIDGDRTCARLRDGSAMCWGGAPRDYDRSDEAARARLPRTMESAATTNVDDVGRRTHGECECQLDDAGVVHCIGSGILSAQLADGSSPPVQLHHCPADKLAGVRTLADRCAIMTDGTVRCWGGIFLARAGGPPIYDDLQEPLAIDGLTDATGIAVGSSHVCVLAGSGALQCWGGNAQGQVDGTPSETGVWPPRRIDATR